MARLTYDPTTGSLFIEPTTIWETIVLAWRIYRYPQKYKVFGCLKNEVNAELSTQPDVGQAYKKLMSG